MNQGGNIFGNKPGTTAPTGGNLFGAATNPPAAGTGTATTGATTNPPAANPAPAGGALFSSTANKPAGNMFGNSGTAATTGTTGTATTTAPSTNPLGGAGTGGGVNLFGPKPTEAAKPTGTTTPATTAPTTTAPTTAPSTTAPVGNLFGANTGATTNPPAATTTTTAPAGGNLFGAGTGATGTSLPFGGNKDPKANPTGTQPSTATTQPSTTTAPGTTAPAAGTAAPATGTQPGTGATGQGTGGTGGAPLFGGAGGTGGGAPAPATAVDPLEAQFDKSTKTVEEYINDFKKTFMNGYEDLQTLADKTLRLLEEKEENEKIAENFGKLDPHIGGNTQSVLRTLENIERQQDEIEMALDVMDRKIGEGQYTHPLTGHLREFAQLQEEVRELGEGGEWSDPGNQQLLNVFENLNQVEMQIRDMDEVIDIYMRDYSADRHY